MPAPGWKKKTKSPSGVGLALVNEQKAAQKSHADAAERFRKGGLDSVLETRDLEDVLEKAELAGRIFAAENPVPRLLIDSEGDQTNLSAEDAERKRLEEEAQHGASLTVPRRPEWTSGMTAEELNAEEQRSFLSWRRGLAQLEVNENLVVTPFEKNLDVWRQLWRVLERSDLVVVVVDARNPLFYRCPDLEAYVRELGGNKEVVLLLNKADLLPPVARREWAAYFSSVQLPFLFWSAKDATSVLEGKLDLPTEVNAEDVVDDEIRVLGRDELLQRLQEKAESIAELQSQRAGAALSDHLKQDPSAIGKTSTGGSRIFEGEKSSKLSRRVVVGFVGYPNVGKSSTINALVGAKRTGVTSTPGKTKHFQTLIISDQLMLCDCPGLVFPSFSSSKSEMVASGVLSIDKLSDHRGPVQVVANNVPRTILEEVYRILLPKPKLYEVQSRPPSAAELLFVIAASRGYFANSGLPDETRAARLILKDYINGKLPYCHLPPGSSAVPSFELRESASEALTQDHILGTDDGSSEEDVEETSEATLEAGGTTPSDTMFQSATVSADANSAEIPDNLLGVVDQTDENLARAFADLDASLDPGQSSSRRESKASSAIHKQQKKAPRRKDRTWRVGRTQSGESPVVNGVKIPVSYGAASRYQLQVFE